MQADGSMNSKKEIRDCLNKMIYEITKENHDHVAKVFGFLTISFNKIKLYVEYKKNIVYFDRLLKLINSIESELEDIYWDCYGDAPGGQGNPYNGKYLTKEWYNKPPSEWDLK